MAGVAERQEIAIGIGDAPFDFDDLLVRQCEVVAGAVVGAAERGVWADKDLPKRIIWRSQPCWSSHSERGAAAAARSGC